MPLHLTLATVLLAVQVPTHGTIEGVVRGYEQTSGRTLAFATVEAATPGGHRTAAADSLGRYRFEDLPAGLVRLRISHPGHRSARVDVQVPAGGTVSLDVDLERRPILLSPIEVLGDPVTRGRTPGAVDPPLADIEVITLGLSPGLGESGLGEAAATLPGNDPADPTDVLFMRGSTTDLKLVLLDGAPRLHAVPSRRAAQQLRRVRPWRGGAPCGGRACSLRRGALLHTGPAHQDSQEGPVAGTGGNRPDQRAGGPGGAHR